MERSTRESSVGDAPDDLRLFLNREDTNANKMKPMPIKPVTTSGISYLMEKRSRAAKAPMA